MAVTAPFSARAPLLTALRALKKELQRAGIQRARLADQGKYLGAKRDPAARALTIFQPDGDCLVSDRQARLDLR